MECKRPYPFKARKIRILNKETKVSKTVIGLEAAANYLNTSTSTVHRWIKNKTSTRKDIEITYID